MSASITRWRSNTLRLIVVSLVTVSALSSLGVAEAKTVKEPVPKADWPKSFANKYKKAKKLMRQCKWAPAYKRLIRFKKPLIKYRGWHGARDLAVASYSINKGKGKMARVGKKWARYGLRIGPRASNHPDATNFFEILQGFYVIPTDPRLCH